MLCHRCVEGSKSMLDYSMDGMDVWFLLCGIHLGLVHNQLHAGSHGHCFQQNNVGVP